MDRRVLATAIAMAVIGSGLTACGNDPEASPSPATSISTATTPTPTTATPSATPTPSEDPRFTEAKAVHLKYLSELISFEKSGGGTELPPQMSALVGGAYKKTVQRTYALFEESGLRAEPDSKWSRPSTWRISTTGNHMIAIGACVDLRGVTYSKKGTQKTARGPWRLDELQFDRKGSTLIITEGRTTKVTSCG